MERFNALVDQILPHNEFYAQKLVNVKRPIKSLAELAEWPFTFKEELTGSARARRRGKSSHLADGAVHAISSDVGHQWRPLVVLDTPDDWQWVLECWQYVLDAAGVTCGRSGVDGVFVWAAHRFLECV